MSWLQKTREKLKAGPRREVPSGLWIKCEGCGEILYSKELDTTLWTCPKCDYHFRVSAPAFIRMITDSFEERDREGSLSGQRVSGPTYNHRPAPGSGLARGEVVWDDGQLLSRPGRGQFIARQRPFPPQQSLPRVLAL